MKPLLIAAPLLALALFPGCLDRVAGSTSTGNTGKGTIAGRVLDTAGKGVANAKVRVVAADHNPGPGGGAGDIEAIAVTGADGSFRTDSLPDGFYNLLDAKEDQLAFRDSVAVKGDNATLVANDVLKPAGSVAGVVRLQSGHDSRTVFLILMGTTTFAVPKDSIGSFALGNLAEGEYRLRILSTLDAYQPMDTVIRVEAGVKRILPDTLRLRYRPSEGGLPIIHDVGVTYDSTRLAVSLSWPGQDPAKVAAYNVYRKAKDSAFIKLTGAPIADTFFLDGLVTGILPGQSYQYAVTALDARGNEGFKGTPAAVTAGVRYHIDTVLAGSDCGPGICHFDIDTAGTIWVVERNGHFKRIPVAAAAARFADTLADAFAFKQIKADGKGGVYLLEPMPLRVAHYDSAGRLLWVTPLPYDRDVSFELHVNGDTALVWVEEQRVMNHLDRTSGRLVRQDTLLKSFVPPPNGFDYPSYKPGIGFYVNTIDGINFLDRNGKITSRWEPQVHEYLRDFTRDPLGRWYVSWSTGELDVYTAEKDFLQPILVVAQLDLTYWRGGLYGQAFPGSALVRITTGL